MSARAPGRREDQPLLTIRLLTECGVPRTLSELNDEIMRETLIRCDYSPARTARALGIGRSTFYRKLEDGSLGLCLLPADTRAARPGQERIVELLSEPRSIGELQRETGRSRQAVHQIVGKLIRNGSVVRHAPIAGRRGSLLVRRRSPEAD